MTDTEKYIPTPPDEYTYHNLLFADFYDEDRTVSFRKFLVQANLAALAPLGIGVLILWLPYQVYLIAGTPYAIASDLTFPRWLAFLIGVLIVIASMALHEMLHGVSLWMMGYRPVLSIARGYLWAGLRNDDFLSRRHYLVMSLTPLVSMTVVGGLLLLILPPIIGKWWLIALLLNMAASVGDLWVAARVYRWPTEAMFNDDHGIQVYLPLDTAQVSGKAKNRFSPVHSE